MTTDSDGDGVVDGLDDQDYDGWSNLSEMSRIMANGLDDGTPLGTNRARRLPEPLQPVPAAQLALQPPQRAGLHALAAAHQPADAVRVLALRRHHLREQVLAGGE